jgi:hypothetical protein
MVRFEHDQIFQHPNIGPFLCHQLIQRLVTSHPSPGYIYRVVSKFNDNGSGVRGDLKAVIKAILLDHEARSVALANTEETFGKQREPVLRVTQLARAFRPANSFAGTYAQDGGLITVNTGAVLDLAGIALAAEPVTLTGGALVNSSSIEATLAGPLTVANDTTLPAHGPIILVGGIHGTATLSVEGALTLGGASTRSGNLTVEPGGSLRVTGHSGPGATTVSAGALLRGSGTLGGPVTVAGSLETETTPATLASSSLSHTTGPPRFSVSIIRLSL